ncbi:hypothetical protein [Mycobacterium sp. IS-1742]|uniref:hypothetical protein n=1 Tax=Mycobacterium sp. IS-1742 TaxID=1772285 RepID=UPI000A448850|nr:hypothetical protein [Mycobacterium sp. IS-1742]
MTELRVNTGELANGGNGLVSGAQAIPEPLQPLVTTGTDALSLALAARTNEVELPLIEGMPKTKAEALATAENIIRAAALYEQSDQQIADQVRKALAELDGAQAAGGGGAAGGGAGAGAVGTATGAAGGGGAGAGQDMGQMMGMPMQLAQQAAQIPMQLAGMAMQIPQGIMQGVQSGMQQVGQMTSQFGETDGAEKDEKATLEDELREKEDVPAEEREQEGAAPAEGTGERAPEYVPRHAAPETPDAAAAPEPTPPGPKPAPTRPADSSIVL